MTEPILPPLKPIHIKDRVSVIYVEKEHLDVLDGAFVVVDKTGVRTHLPIGGVACLMLEPGTRVSHAAVVLAARTIGSTYVPRTRGDEPEPPGGRRLRLARSPHTRKQEGHFRKCPLRSVRIRF